MSHVAAQIVREIAEKYGSYYINPERMVSAYGVVQILSTRLDKKREEIFDDLQQHFYFDRAGVMAYFYKDGHRHFYIRDAYLESSMDGFRQVFREVPVFLCVDGLHTNIPLFMDQSNFDFWIHYGNANFDCTSPDSLYVEQGDEARVLIVRRLNKALGKLDG